MNSTPPQIPESREGEVQQESIPATTIESDDAEMNSAQGMGCLISFALTIVLLIVPKVIALVKGLHSDGTWIYPPIGVLIFWLLTITTLVTGRIPYRSKDMDLRANPILRYAAVVVFALAAVGMYGVYLAMIFGW